MGGELNKPSDSTIRKAQEKIIKQIFSKYSEADLHVVWGSKEVIEPSYSEMDKTTSFGGLKFLIQMPSGQKYQIAVWHTRGDQFNVSLTIIKDGGVNYTRFSVTKKFKELDEVVKKMIGEVE